MSILSELKDRKVIRVAGIYLVVAWLIMQVVDVVSEPLYLPDWFNTAVLLLLVLGFPIALIFSWIFDATPAKGSGKGKPLAIGLIAATAVVVGLILGNFKSDDAEPDTLTVYTEENAVSPSANSFAAEAEGQLLPNSVAVLLCDNLSPDPDDAYFAAGIHEEILNQLVKLSALNVIARTSVLKYSETNLTIPEIADELRVESVLECSVRFAGSSIMVTAQLIDPESNSHLWSETYPGDISDLSGVFAMQADIAFNIANALQTELSPAEQQRVRSQPTNSPEAYRLYLQATAMGVYLNVDEIVELMDEAIALDPEFAHAYAYKAVTMAVATSFEFDKELEQRALQSAGIALELDPNSMNALVALGVTNQNNWRKSEADRIYKKLLGLYPNDASILATTAAFYRFTGDYQRSFELIDRAVDLDPNAHEVWRHLSITQLFAGQPEDALATMRNALALDSGNVSAVWNLIVIYLALGQHDKALDSWPRFREIAGNRKQPIDIAAQTALMLSQAGADESTRSIVDKLRSEIPADSTGNLALATALLAVGDIDGGYDEMRKAVESREARETPLGFQISNRLRMNIWNHPVLEEPRFVELRRQLGYPDD